MRAFVLAAAVILFHLPAHAQLQNRDMPGFDYADFDTSSWPLCRNSCAGDAKCQAWTWVKPKPGQPGHCWLKTKTVPPTPNTCCISQWHRDASREKVAQPENGIDRPGLDYRSLDIDTWASCQGWCEYEAQCSAWTFVQAGVQGPKARCWLKNAVPIPVSNSRTISGVKFRPASVRIDP